MVFDSKGQRVVIKPLNMRKLPEQEQEFLNQLNAQLVNSGAENDPEVDPVSAENENKHQIEAQQLPENTEQLIQNLPEAAMHRYDRWAENP